MAGPAGAAAEAAIIFVIEDDDVRDDVTDNSTGPTSGIVARTFGRTSAGEVVGGSASAVEPPLALSTAAASLGAAAFATAAPAAQEEGAAVPAAAGTGDSHSIQVQLTHRNASSTALAAQTEPSGGVTAVGGDECSPLIPKPADGQIPQQQPSKRSKADSSMSYFVAAAAAAATLLLSRWRQSAAFRGAAMSLAAVVAVTTLVVWAIPLVRSLLHPLGFERSLEQQHWEKQALGSWGRSGPAVTEEGFDVVAAARLWHKEVGCASFRTKHAKLIKGYSARRFPQSPALQSVDKYSCADMKLAHVTIFVKEKSWVFPNKLDNFYHCPRCGLTCQVTFYEASAAHADANLFVWPKTPDPRNGSGDPLRIYINMEEFHKPQHEHPEWFDVLVDHTTSSDVQLSYKDMDKTMGAGESKEVSTHKLQDVPLYRASSNCDVATREEQVRLIQSKVKTHSFGKCQNTVGGPGKEAEMYPNCTHPMGDWNKELPTGCVLSHYKFALYIENRIASGYVTEKAFRCLEFGTVPIYYGSPDIEQFMPPDSFINGNKFRPDELADRINELNADPVKYMDYFAWRMCGVLGSYAHARELGFNNLPCRVCEAVSAIGGRSHASHT